MMESSKKIAVLLVTPDLKEAKLIEQLLAQAKYSTYHTVSVNTLISAVEALQQNPFDIILTGHHLTESEGEKAIAKIHFDTIDVPIIALTDYEDEKKIAELTAQGAEDCLIKKYLNSYLLEKFIDYTILQKQQLDNIKNITVYNESKDILTNLPNRNFFEKKLKQLIIECNKERKFFALLLIDIDNFEKINEKYGRNAGDLILKDIAVKLQSSLRGEDIVARLDETDLVARLGGDEFAVILKEIRKPTDAGLVSRRLLRTFNTTLDILGNKIKVTVSIGIACYPFATHKIVNLIKAADEALYLAKQNNGNHYQFYLQHMNERRIKQTELTQALESAIKNQEFSLSYQPRFALPSKKLTGIEVLVRWDNPTLGVILPEDFIPIAEESGLITQIDEWVFTTACQQYKKWGTDIILAINLSPRNLQEGSLANSIEKILQSTNIKASNIEIELTETALLGNSTLEKRLLSQIHDMGFKLAIDDFGTGYSSLTHIKSLPISIIKIDKSFIKNVNHDSNDSKIVKAILSLAQNMGLEVVAEGVETEKQIEFLVNINCHQAQGAYFSEPLKAAEMAKLLNKYCHINL